VHRSIRDNVDFLKKNLHSAGAWIAPFGLLYCLRDRRDAIVESTMSSQVFISHSSADAKVARAICTALENRGLPCWLASRDVRPGENFQEAIVNAIRSAKVMVLVFTDNANSSDEIKKELVLASQNKLTIIPARVEDVVPNAALAYEFATRQWIDLFGDWEREIERLTAWVASILSIEPGTAPPKAAIPVRDSDAPEGSSAWATSPASLSKNPLDHLAGAFLIVVGAFLFVFFLSSLMEGQPAVGPLSGYGPPTSEAGPSFDDIRCHAMGGRACPQSPVTYGFAMLLMLVAVAAAIAAGLGTFRKRKWARILGLGLCAAGLAISAYLTFAIAATVSCKEIECFRIGAIRPDLILLGAAISALFGIAFAGASTIYMWGWKSSLSPNLNEPHRARIIAFARRDGVFGTAVVVMCALTAGAFYLYRLAPHESELLWLSVLVALDALVFVYCTIDFHKEFGSTQAAGIASKTKRAGP
jgi:hypothetical protein